MSVFLISLRAGGTGLNLTAADIVIHYDPWWNLSLIHICRTTCLGLAIEQMPTHVAGLPVAVNVSCHVTRRASAEL